MSKLELSSRVLAASFFLLAAVGPMIAWGVYLFHLNPEAWRESLEYALSPENEFRTFFVMMGAAGIFSCLAFVIVAVGRRRLVLRGVLVAGIIQSIAYAVFGAWFLAFVSAMPLWWVYKVEHEV